MTISVLAIAMLSGPGDARAASPEQLLQDRLTVLQQDGWKLLRPRRGVHVLSREVPDSRIREVRALTVAQAPARRIVNIIGTFERYPEFVPYLVESRRVYATEEAVWLFQQLNFRWPLRDRYFTVRLTRSGSAELGYRFDWALTKEHQKKGRGIALPVTVGSWHITQPGTEPVSLMEYYLYADPGGLLPAWAVRQGYRRAIPAVVDAFRKRAEGD